MKFQCAIEINLPRAAVISLLYEEDHRHLWQDGFEVAEPMEGSPGSPGAKTRLIYRNGKRSLELIETILTSDLPETFSALYEAKQMTNTMHNQFVALDDHRMRWIASLAYSAFHGILPRLMALPSPGMFREQTLKWMKQFKTFAEKQNTGQ